jgi:hypothetical protein
MICKCFLQIIKKEVNESNEKGETFFLNVEGSQEECSKMLLEAGSNMSTPDKIRKL